MSSQHPSRRARALALSLSVSAAMAASAVQAAPDDQQTIEALRTQLQQMQERLDRLEQQQQASGTSSTSSSSTSGSSSSSTSGNSGSQLSGNSNSASNTTSSSSGGNSTQDGLEQSGAGEQVAQEQRSGEDQQSLAQQNQSAIEELRQTQIGGTLEFGGSFNDWDEVSKDTGGDLDFGKFIIAVEGEVENLDYSLEYRFYDGYRFLQHGWLGFNPTDNDTVRVGLVQTPFGNMDYGYLGWYGNLGYLAGFNDNQNAGIKWDHDAGPWNTSLAFFKSDHLGEGNEHYGANPAGGTTVSTLDDDGNPTVGEQGNAEENQLAGRVAYTFGHDTDYTTEINFSAKGGQLYNEQTNDSGSSWQTALGMDGNYGNWRTLLQATAYGYHAENPDESVSGVSNDVIQLGAFGFNYNIPARGQIYTASLGYSMDVEWGPVTNLYFFNDYSYMQPDGDYPLAGRSDISNPQLNDLGVLVSAGPYYAWFDIVTNKNGLNYFGSPIDDGWHTSFLTNFGIQF